MRSWHSIGSVVAAGIFWSVWPFGSASAHSTPMVLSEPALEARLPAMPEDNRGGGVITHDLNSDGKRDFLVTREGMVIAVAADGTLLWQRDVNIHVRQPDKGNQLPNIHGPGIQAADVVGDDAAEVLYLTRNSEVHIVAGATGKLLHASASVPVPAEAVRWEHLVVGNFRGQGDRDILLQTTNKRGYRLGRFLAAYAIEDLIHEQQPEPLWTRDDFSSAAHNGARIADLDGDGRDEIVGGAIFSPDGESLYSLPVEDTARDHIDSVQIADVLPDRPGLEVVATQEGGAYNLLPFSNGFASWVNWNLRERGICCEGQHTFLMDTGGLIWEREHLQREPQNSAVGQFQPESDQLQIWLRSRFAEKQKPFVFDARGNLITSYELTETAPQDWTSKGIEVIHSIHWSGSGKQHLAAKARHESGDVAIVDALTGEFIVRVPERADRLYVADVRGDWREELIVLSGNRLRIYANTADNPNPDHPSLWSQPYYQRLKQTWNYYSP